MGSSLNSNLDKLKFIAEHDSNFCLVKNILTVNAEKSAIHIDVSRISNVRIKKRRCLKLNYLMVSLTLFACLLLNRIFDLNFIIQCIVGLIALFSFLYSLFVSKSSYELMINYNDLHFNNFKLAASTFDKLDYSF